MRNEGQGGKGHHPGHEEDCPLTGAGDGRQRGLRWLVAVVIFVLRPTDAAMLCAYGAVSFGIARLKSLTLVVKVGLCRGPLTGGDRSESGFCRLL